MECRRFMWRVALVVCTAGAAFAGGDEGAAYPHGLRPSGLSVTVERRAFTPRLALPGEVRSTRRHQVVSHYRYWTVVGWMANEGDMVSEGDPVAQVFNEAIETRVAQRRRSVRHGRAHAEAARARGEFAEIEEAQAIRAAELALRRAELRLEEIEHGASAEDLQLAESARQRRRLERDVATVALARAKGLAEVGLVADEAARELEQKHSLAEARLAKAEADLTVLRNRPAEPERLAAQRAVAVAQAGVEAARQAAASAQEQRAAVLAYWEREIMVRLAGQEHWLGCMENETRRAPISGIVVRPPIYVGGKARPGVGPLWTATIASILDPSQWAFVARATEEEVAQISVGQAAEVFVRGIAGAGLTGRVTAVAVTPDDLSRTAQFAQWEERPAADVNIYDVVIAVDGHEAIHLPQGMGGEAVITQEDTRESLLVPQACVGHDDREQWVLLRRHGAWEPCAIDVVKEHDGMAVVAAGLQPGDEVAILSE